jgi:hypothetical protein
MLRWFLIIVGAAFIVLGFVTLRAYGEFGWPVAADLLVGGVFLLLVILGEARRYRTKRSAAGGSWETTGERFVDPTTGKLTEVRYNPQTGEREYIEGTEKP